MKNLVIFIFSFFITITFSSCEKKIIEQNIEIIVSNAITDESIDTFKRDMESIATPYLCGDSILHIPLIKVYRIDSLESGQTLTSRINRSISGDPKNAIRAKRKLKEQIHTFQPNNLLSKNTNIQNHQINEYYTRVFQKSNKNRVLVLSESDLELDSIPHSKNSILIKRIDDLKKKINDKLCKSVNVEQKFTILYKPLTPLIDYPPIEIVEENEAAFENGNKKRLIELGKKIEKALDRNPLQWRLWYALSINRIKLGGTKFLNDGIECLRNAAKEAIDESEGRDLLRLLEKKEAFILKSYKNSQKSRHPIAIFQALRRNEKCLINVVTGTLIKETWHTIGKNTVNLIPTALYRNSYWGFRISVKEKFDDGSILVDMFIPNTKGVIEKLDYRMRLGQEYRAILSDEKIDINKGTTDGEWEFVFINESPLHCSNVKLRYDIKEREKLKEQDTIKIN